MINLILNELFIDLAHKIVLWLKFYKSLTAVIDQIQRNILSFENFTISNLSAKNIHLTNDYNYMVDLGLVVHFVNCLEKTIVCLMLYDNYVYNYIKTINFNVCTIPRSVSGIVDIKQPLSNKTKYEVLLKTCKNLRERILQVKAGNNGEENLIKKDDK